MRVEPEVIEAVQQIQEGYQPCSLDLRRGKFTEARKSGLIRMVAGRWGVTDMGRAYARNGDAR
jgi:hypothetical protein